MVVLYHMIIYVSIQQYNFLPALNCPNVVHSRHDNHAQQLEKHSVESDFRIGRVLIAFHCLKEFCNNSKSYKDPYRIVLF